MDDTIIADFDGQQVEIPANKASDPAYIRQIRSQLVKNSTTPTSPQAQEPSLIKKGWEALKVPEQKSREGLQMITEAITPSMEDIEAGKTSIPGMAARAGMEALTEVAPSFVSRGALVTSGALGAAKAALPLAKAAGRAIGKAAEGISGLEYKTPGVLGEAANDPSLIFSKGKEAVGEMYGKLVDKANIRPEIANALSHDEVIKAGKDALAAGNLTPDEGLIVRQSLDKLKNSIPKFAYKTARAAFDEIAKTKFGDVDKLFQRGVKADALRTIFATNKSGGTSIAKGILGTLAGGIPNLVMSPVVQGTMAGGAGLVAKGIEKLSIPAIYALSAILNSRKQ